MEWRYSMADDVRKALDLDELFGQARAIKVKWQGKEYELVQFNGMNSYQVLSFQKMRRDIVVAQLDETISAERAAEIEKLFDDMLTILCKDLPLHEISYVEKTTIIAFYFQETQEKKVERLKKELIGAKHTAS